VPVGSSGIGDASSAHSTPDSRSRSAPAAHAAPNPSPRTASAVCFGLAQQPSSQLGIEAVNADQSFACAELGRHGVASTLTLEEALVAASVSGNRVRIGSWKQRSR
jgi:hypothetical protein